MLSLQAQQERKRQQREEKKREEEENINMLVSSTHLFLLGFYMAFNLA